MHEEGLKKSLTNVLNRYARSKGLLKEKEDNLIGEDVREGLIAILSVKLRDPQFEGQTKTKLGNASMRSFVETTVNAQLAEWLEEHPTEASRIVSKTLAAAKARMAAKQARDLTRRKSFLEGRLLARQARRLPAERSGVVRALHRRGGLRRRQRQAGARPRDPGDPARSGGRSSTSRRPGCTRSWRTSRSRR